MLVKKFGEIQSKIIDNFDTITLADIYNEFSGLSLLDNEIIGEILRK